MYPSSQQIPDFYLNVWSSNGDIVLKGSRNFVGRDKPRKVGLGVEWGWCHGLPDSCLLGIKLCLLHCLGLKFPVFPQVIYQSTATSTRPIMDERSSLMRMCLWRQHTFSSEARLGLIPGKLLSLFLITVGLVQRLFSWVDELGSSCFSARLVLSFIMWVTKHVGHFVCFSFYHTSGYGRLCPIQNVLPFFSFSVDPFTLYWSVWTFSSHIWVTLPNLPKLISSDKCSTTGIWNMRALG